MGGFGWKNGVFEVDLVGKWEMGGKKNSVFFDGRVSFFFFFFFVKITDESQTQPQLGQYPFPGTGITPIDSPHQSASSNTTRHSWLSTHRAREVRLLELRDHRRHPGDQSQTQP
jgi:hypothetical protein